MFPQIFNAQGKADKAASDNPLRHHSQFMSTQITHEILSNTSHTTRDSHNVPTRRWFAGKDHAHFMKMYESDFGRKRGLFSKHDLDEVHEEYLRDRELRDRRLEEEKWQTIFTLDQILSDPQYSKIRLAAGDRALYESMFKIEPRKYISRPKFLTTLRLVYGFDLANLNSVSNNLMLDKLNKLYTSFDVANKGEMDWRCFVLMLEMCHDKKSEAKHHVLWGYSLYSSNGSFDLSCEEPMRLGDVKDLFGTMVRLVFKNDMTELCDSAWTSVASRDAQAKAMVAKASQKNLSLDDLKIPFRLFQLMLNQPSMAPLFETGRPWGKKDPGIWTYVIEERYYHPTLLQYIMSERRAAKVEKLADVFLEQKGYRRKRDGVKMWRGYMWRRKRARFLMTENIVRYVIENTSTAWMVYRKWCMKEIAVREIQRMIRGHIGRMEAMFLKILFRSAVLLQKTYRGKLSRRRYLALRRKRNWAASEMQRHVRGILSKRLAMNRLEGFLDSERAKLARQKFDWENAELIKAARSIQGQWRKLMARRKVHLLKDKKEREKMIAKEMEDMIKGHNRDRKVYQKQIEEWYEKKRIDWESTNVTENQTAAEKAKIRAYRRKLKAEEGQEEERQEQVKLDQMEEKRVEQWLKVWSKKASEESEKYKIACRNCMIAPDTPLEKKLGHELKRKVKARTKDVLKRADARLMPMEYPEALDIATDEVLYIMGEEKKKQVMQSMKEEAVLYEEKQKDKEKDLEIQREKERALDRRHAASVLGLAYRKWHARKVLRQKCYERFEKKFSEKYCAYYYHNRMTDDVLWEKPKSLGSYDMQVINEWRPMRDNQKYPYYYNPNTMKMSWKIPRATVACEERVLMTWKFGYPTPQGPCPNFATRRCNEDMRFYCDSCWESKYNVAQRHKLWWKPVVGCEPNSDKIQYDDLDDKLDHFPEDEIAAAQKEWEEKQKKDMETSMFDTSARYDKLAKEPETALDKAMAKHQEPKLSAEDVAAKAESLTAEGLRKNMKTNRQLVSKYTDWMKGGGKGAAMAGVIGKWGSVADNDPFAHFLDKEGNPHPMAELKRVAFKEWQKFRRAAIYDKKFEGQNTRSDAVSDLLTQFGVKVKVQVGGEEEKVKAIEAGPGGGEGGEEKKQELPAIE
ncbi:hypothetical protein TrLO_g13608 [Triparma laevis f. longispina]|uniref:WW domain-containing protein n=1 Tax=Triparma laevis f. longispina TaxID=1714387 RepID=A0A9W7AUP5_9STRA|nr:hypothetical protein TrLO_g13608 [Triparma laevis f. longispina]